MKFEGRLLGYLLAIFLIYIFNGAECQYSQSFGPYDIQNMGDLKLITDHSTPGSLCPEGYRCAEMAPGYLLGFRSHLASTESISSEKKDAGEEWLFKGLAKFEDGMYEQALKCFDKAISYAPKSPTLRYYKGNTLCKLSRYEQALVAFNNAIKMRPRFYQAWNNKAFVLKKLNRNSEASNAASEAEKLENSL